MDSYANSEWALPSLLPTLYWVDSPTTTRASEAQVQPAESAVTAVFASSLPSSLQASTTPPKPYCSPYAPVPSSSGSASADRDNSTSPSSCSSHESPPPPPFPKEHRSPRSSYSSDPKFANPIELPAVTGKRSSEDVGKKRANKAHRVSEDGVSPSFMTQIPSKTYCNQYGGDGALDSEETILPETRAQGDHNYSQIAQVAPIAPSSLNYHGISEQLPQLRHIGAQKYTNVPVASTETFQEILESRPPVTSRPQSVQQTHYPIGSQNDATVPETAFPTHVSQHKQQQIHYTSAGQNDATQSDSVQPYTHEAQSQGQVYHGSANDATFQRAASTSTSGAQSNQEQVQYTTLPNSVPSYTYGAQSHGQGHYGSANQNDATFQQTAYTSTYGAQSTQEKVQYMSAGRNEATPAHFIPQYTYGAQSPGQGHYESANQNHATFPRTASTSIPGVQSKQQQVHYARVAQNGTNLQNSVSSRHYGSANHDDATFPQSTTSTYGAQAQHQQVHFPSVGQGHTTRKPTPPTPRRRESAQYRNIQPAPAAAAQHYTQPVSAPSSVNQEFAQYPQNCIAQPAPVPNNYGQRANTNSPTPQNNVPHAQMQSAPHNHTQFVPTSFPVTQKYVSHPHNQPTQQVAPATHNCTQRAATASQANEIANRFANSTSHIHHENHGQYVPPSPKEFGSKWTQDELFELTQSPQLFVSVHQPHAPYENSPFVQKCTTCNDMTCLQCVIHYWERHYKIPYLLLSLAKYKGWQCRGMEKPDDQILQVAVGKRLDWLKGILENAEKEINNIVAYHTPHYKPSIVVSDPVPELQSEYAPPAPIAAPTVKRNPAKGQFAPGNTSVNKGVTKPLDSNRVTNKSMNGMPVNGKLWPDENKMPVVRRRGRPSLGPTDTLNEKKRRAVEAALNAAAIPGYTVLA